MSQGDLAPGSESTSLKLVVRSQQIGNDILQLRERVLRDEERLLSDADIVSRDDEIGTHCCLYHNGTLAASALGLAAEDSSFPARMGVATEQLKSHYYVTRVIVAPEFRQQGLATLLVYSLFREGRILGRKTAVGLFSQTDAIPAVLTGALPFQGLAPLTFTGHQNHTFELRAMLADINYGMYRCWNRLREEPRLLVSDSLLADEVLRTVLRETERFYENPWFKRVAAHTLTRGQYVEFLANNYQFVRWTTRILARVASLAEDADLRNHYLQHLAGEVDHEEIIERDLKYLGADVEYICRHMSPCVDIGHFMGIQEGLVGLRGDPVNLLAVPIAIESLTAHLSGSFLQDLEACVRRWGYSDPSQAVQYLRSHIPIDGGDDGHWARTAKIMQRYIKSEPEAQRFLGIVRMVIVAIDRALQSYVEASDFM